MVRHDFQIKKTTVTRYIFFNFPKEKLSNYIFPIFSDPCMTLDSSIVLHFGQGFFLPNLCVIFFCGFVNMGSISAAFSTRYPNPLGRYVTKQKPLQKPPKNCQKGQGIQYRVFSDEKYQNGQAYFVCKHDKLIKMEKGFEKPIQTIPQNKLWIVGRHQRQPKNLVS